MLPRQARGMIGRETAELGEDSIEVNPAGAKIDVQALIAKEVQTEQPIYTGARWQGVAENWKIRAPLPQSGEFLGFHAGRELDAASGSNLHSLSGQRGVVTDSEKHCNAHQCAGCTGVKRKLQDAAPGGSKKLRADDNEASLGIEREAHRTMAVSNGILPVKTMANRFGRISTARR